MELAHLDDCISEQEVHLALGQMPKNRASGPDGIPIEFYQSFWDLVRPNLMGIIGQFHNSKSNVSCVNKTQITLISKKEDASQIRDFRPISVINTTTKLFTKVLVNRLQSIMPMIISNKQTAFVKARSMMKSFLVARELLCHETKRKLPTILYKVDFEKAFDTVDWCFLSNLLIEKGFPPKWTSVVLNTLRTSHSVVCTNSSITR